MSNVLGQWEIAAKQFAANQECSEYATINKDVVKHRFQRLDGNKVLDLGCGYGYYTAYFDSIGAKTIGIDGAEAMVKIAKEQYSEEL